MAIKVIITGASGMVGKGVLLYCLQDPNIAAVLSIGRRPLGITHPRLSELIQENFYDFPGRENALQGYDACFFCLGTSSAGKSEAVYTRITRDLTLGFAAVLHRASPQAVFCYVSGEGTDASEQGKTMWARVKGKTENALLRMGFKDAYMFRPGFIKALQGATSKTKLYALLYILFRPLLPLIMRFPGLATNSDRIARAMIAVSLKTHEKKILNTFEINRIAALYPVPITDVVNETTR